MSRRNPSALDVAPALWALVLAAALVVVAAVVVNLAGGFS